MQNRPLGECEDPENTRESKITSKSRLRQPTELIVADAFGLTDEEFKMLITDWIVPQLIDEFITQKRAQPVQRKVSHRSPGADGE
jgi:hypothetical protein